MLDPGCVLRLVHTDIPVLLLKILQYLRHLAQNCQSIHHLVIIVHQMLVPQPVVVPLINRGDIDVTVRRSQGASLLLTERPDLLFRQHLVLNIGDKCPHIAQIRLRRPGLLHLLINLSQDARRTLFICHQFKRLLPDHPAVIRYDLRADPVDRPKLQPFRQFRAKISRKSLRHVPRSSDRIRHCQNILRLDPTVKNHISQPQYQNCCLTASGHRQQQNRSFHRLHRFRLLGIEHDPIIGTLMPGI